MKKKIKDLTPKQAEKLCDKHICCCDCPLYIGDKKCLYRMFNKEIDL